MTRNAWQSVIKTSDFLAKRQRKLSCELMFSAFRRCREHSFEKFQTNSAIRYKAF